MKSEEFYSIKENIEKSSVKSMLNELVTE